MEETSNNILTKKNLLFFLVIVVVILLAWFVWKNYQTPKNAVDNTVQVNFGPELEKTPEQLLAEQEMVVFESKDKVPTMFPSDFPAETNPVEIERSKAIKSLQAKDKDLIFVNYNYYSLIPKDRIFSSFEKFFVDNGYTLEKTQESSYSNLYATKGEYEIYSVTIAETDGGISYVTISLTTK